MLLWLANIINGISDQCIIGSVPVRGVMATLTALVIGLAAGPAVIRQLTRLKVGQAVRTDGPQTHLVKSGTPTMGGILIMIAIAIGTLLWCDWSNRFIWVMLLVTLGYGAIGWVDDYRKVVYKDPNGMRSREKYFWQSLIGIVSSVYLAFCLMGHSNAEVWTLFMNWVSGGFSSELPKQMDIVLPCLTTFGYPLGIWGFMILTYFVIVGTSNAVNLTDGLDGLTIVPTILVGGALGVFAYVSGNPTASEIFVVPHIAGTDELVIFCGAMAGAGLAFLWFNAHPAQMFMGDVGALALGGALGTLSVIVRQEILLAIMGGIFVAETISVMLQVSYFKYTKKKYGEGRRIFLMAPLHHHFEQKGWKETKVVIRFWIITIILVLIGLATLKMR